MSDTLQPAGTYTVLVTGSELHRIRRCLSNDLDRLACLDNQESEVASQTAQALAAAFKPVLMTAEWEDKALQAAD